MIVKLITHTESPEITVAAAARVCYASTGSDAELIRKLVKMGHLSPLEHASFTFSVDGISRACSHQLVRHRIASFSQRSQRYVSEDGFGFVIPPGIDDATLLIFRGAMRDLQKAYNRLIGFGIPKEDARYVLPNACETKLVVTMNARSLLHFFKVRCCRRAQWEIRRLAREMLAEVRKVAPVLFEKAGPKCETEGICPEGTMSCGRWKRAEMGQLP